MSKIGIDVEANISKAKKDLQSLDKEVKNLQKTASKGAKINLKGVAPKGGNGSNSKGGFSIGGMQIDKLGDLGQLTDVKGLLRGGLGRLGGMSLGGLGGVAAGAAAGAGVAVAAAGAWYSHVKGLVEQGKEAQTTYERLSATLGQIGKNVAGVSDVSTTVKFLQETAAKGKTPLEALEQTANRLMVAFQGNQSEVKKWTEIIADMSAGSGESATMLTEVITKAKQFDTVEFSVFTQLNEKGIPIIKSLADHLGITTEKAEELARAGKVTGDNFMAAYEIAHRMTFAGANAQGGTSTVAGAQNAITQYQALQAAAATEGYNSQMLPYLQERAALEEQRYKDAHYRLSNQASGMLVGSLDKGWQTFTDSVSDFGDWCAKLVSSGSVDSLSSSESIGASIGTLGFRNFGVEGVMYKSQQSVERLQREVDEAQQDYDLYQDDESKARLERAQQALNDNWENSAVIDGYLQSMRAQLEQERSKISNDEFSDEARANARQAAQDLSEAISICEDALRAVKAHEAELAEIEKQKRAEAEGQRVRDAYNLSRADTASAYATAMGFSSLDALKGEYNTIRGRIDDGKGTQADLDRLNELQKVIDLAEKEAETAARQAQSRREYDLSAAAAGGDQASRVQLQLEQESAKLKALGFTPDEVESRLNAMRDRLITEAEEKQRQTSASLENQYSSISYACGGGAMDYHKWERNAWGAAGATYTTFQNPLDQQQLDQLERANANLTSLIKATREIDTRTLAQ